MAVRGLGYPVRFILTAGQRGDAPQAGPLIEGLPADVIMAIDLGFQISMELIQTVCRMEAGRHVESSVC